MTRVWLTAGAVLLAAGLGCKPSGGDRTKVLATVGGEKITQQVFEANIKAMAPDEAQAKDFISAEARKGARETFLKQLAESKAVIRWATLEGLDKDPKAKVMLEQAKAQAYFRLIMERRTAALKPTDADLKALYDERTAAAKGAPDAKIPPFEDVKERVAEMWQQQQASKVQEQFLKEVSQKVKITYADGK